MQCVMLLVSTDAFWRGLMGGLTVAGQVQVRCWPLALRCPGVTACTACDCEPMPEWHLLPGRLGVDLLSVPHRGACALCWPHFIRISLAVRCGLAACVHSTLYSSAEQLFGR